MRVLLLTLGTRGDVQPFVALGCRLLDAGHEVTVCASESFASFIEEHGLRYAYLNDDIVELANSEAGRTAMEEADSVLGFFKWYATAARQVKPIYRRTLREEWEAARGAEAIVYHPKAVGGLHIAEALGIPGIMAALLPAFVPTREFPNPVLPDVSLGSWYNRFTYRFVPLLTQLFLGSVVNQWREEVLGLPSRSWFDSDLVHTDGRAVPVMHAISPHVLPSPADWPDHSWMTGYWFLEENDTWRPPEGLVQFLEAGEPPVYVGFGSISGRNPGKTANTVTEALARTGQRGILATGWGGLEARALPETILQIDSVPHAWLFPQVAAVVHHGGAGTTASGLRAGTPSIICPFFGDQPFWGGRVAQLGVGPDPVPQRKLSVTRLADRIEEAITDVEMKKRAAALGEKIRAENGLDNALRRIEEYANDAA